MIINIMNIISKITGLFGIACFTILGFECIQVIKQNKATITVYGLADKIVTSDKAIMTLSFSENGNDINEINSKLNKNKKAIYSFLSGNGIEDKDIQEENVAIQDNYYEYYYGENKGKIPDIRYKITKTIVIDTNKVNIAREIQNKITNLLENNIFVTTNIKYSYSKFDDLKLKLIEDATRDAMDRANHIAKVSNCNLKKLRNLYTGKFNILDGSNTAADSESWSNGETTYKKRYRIIVNVTYDKD